MRNICILVLTLLFTFTANAFDFTVNGLKYSTGTETSVYLSAGQNASLSGALEIPDSVTYEGKTYAVEAIGMTAFRDCASITSVTFPSGLLTIGSEAFRGCSGLNTVKIPATVTAIYNGAFYGCAALTTINCAAVTPPSIYSNCFYNVDQINCTVVVPHDAGAAYSSAAGWSAFTILEQAVDAYDVTVTEGGKLLYAIGINNMKKVYKLTVSGPINGTDILVLRNNKLLPFLKILDLTNATIVSGGNAYYESNYTSDNRIGDYMFTAMALDSLTLPESVTSLGFQSISYCPSLTTVTIPSGVTSLGSWTFLGCSHLTSVVLPSEITSIGMAAFYQCGSLASITIPEGVTSIEGSAFYQCSSLASVTIPESVTSIGTNVFEGCGALTSVKLPSGITTISANAFVSCGLTSVIIPSGVNSIGSRAFAGCGNLTSLTIPSGVITIGNSAFVECSALASVVIPSSVTSIGIQAFRGCSKLASVSIPEGVTSIGEQAFWFCTALTSVAIPTGVTTIAKQTFYNCSSLTSVMLPATLSSIADYAFFNCTSLSSIHLQGVNAPGVGGNALYDVNRNTCKLYVTEGAYLTYYMAGTWSEFKNIEEEKNEFIVDGLKYLKNTDGLSVRVAPGQNPSLSGEMVIPANVTYLDKNYAVTVIGESAFNACSGLTSVTIPEGVTLIWESAFERCSGLTSVILPSTLTSIGNNAFKYCSLLASMTIPNGVNAIGENAFWYCRALPYLILPEGLLTIGKYAFAYCEGLSSVSIPSSVTSIGVYGFYYCSKLTALTIPSGLTALEEGTFKFCYRVTSVTIPRSVTSIGTDVFCRCDALKEIHALNPSPAVMGSFVFYSVNTSTCILNVPFGAKAAYAAAYLWKDFVNIVEEDATDVTRTEDGPVLVFSDGDGIVVRGAEEGATITVYTLSGVQLLTLSATGDEQRISLSPGALYIVRIGNQTMKVGV